MGSLFSVRLSDGPFLRLLFLLPCDTRAHQNVPTADFRDANNLFKNKEGEAKKRKRRRLDIKNNTLAFKNNTRITLVGSYIVVCSETVSVVTVAFRG